MKKDNKKPKKTWVWPLIVLLVALVVSFIFSLLSELALSDANLVISIIVILLFIFINIFVDMLGLAVASCTIEPFTAMSARKVKGSKQALSLIKNADRINSIFTDIIGDVCGILSGAGGAAIVAKLIIESQGDFMVILISSIVSAIVASLTIGGKALGKSIAIKHCESITLKFAQFINFFTRKN